MKTPMLLEVPKDAPSSKEKIETFKKLMGIETHSCHPYPLPDEQKWLACHRPSALAIAKPYGVKDSASMCEIYAEVARLIDECNADAYGSTERDAIRNLCDKRDIPCWL